MSKKPTKSQLETLSQYDRVVIYLFRSLTKDFDGDTLPTLLPFETSDVRTAAAEAHVKQIVPRLIKNLPDIRYTFDARRPMPAEVEQYGPITWMQAGKGKYAFQRTKRRNLIDAALLAQHAGPIETIVDQTPPFVKQLIGKDEQAMFTRVRNAELITSVLGFKAWPVQGHARTTVSYGQIEVDEVQAGLQGNNTCIVPISGKGGRDMLSWTQALNLNTYGAEKSRVKGLPVRSLGLWKDQYDIVWIVEFTPELDIDEIKIKQVKRFKFQ